MISVLNHNEYNYVRNIFDCHFPLISVKSHCHGLTPGKVWVDHENSSCFFIWEQVNGLFYLFGHPKDSSFYVELKQLLSDEVLPQLKQSGYETCTLLTTRAENNPVKNHLFRDIKTEKNMFNCFTLKWSSDNEHASMFEIPTGVTIRQMSSTLLDSGILNNADYVNELTEACWRDMKRYDKQGIGYCLIDGKTITAWCSTDFVIDNNCELYVQTFEEYENRGYATFIASTCVEECKKRYDQIFWNCWADHHASISIAKKLGFTKIESFTATSFKVDERFR